MLIFGILTCTMMYAAVAPQAALVNTFGEAISGPIAEIVVRNWGVLITLGYFKEIITQKVSGAEDGSRQSIFPSQGDVRSAVQEKPWL